MKLLATDYDNTFYINDIDMKGNVESAKEFMKNNLFVIATGRDYNSFMNQQNIYDIKYNYLIINNGATILKNDEIIYNQLLDDDIKKAIIDNVDLNKVRHLICYDGKKQVSVNEHVTKIYLEYYDTDDAIEDFQFIKQNYNDIKTFLFKNFNMVEVMSINVDKANAIEYISKIENVNNIFTIGDSYNDYLMIKNYSGYASSRAIEEVKNIAIKQYDKVSDLIYDIMED